MPDLYEPRIALLGTGQMGAAMGANILKAGYDLVAWDLQHKAATQIAAMGAQVATSPIQAVAGADIIISILRSEAICRDVWLGAHNALANVKARAVVVDCSTLPLATVQELMQAADARAVRWLDAPIIGDVDDARNGTLRLLVGGRKDTLTTAQEVLMQLGTVHYVGPTGSGMAMKLMYSVLAAVQGLAFTEGLAVLQQVGMSPQQVLDILKETPLDSTFLQAVGQRIARPDTPIENGDVRRMQRDLDYAAQLAPRYPLNTALIDAVLTRLGALRASGLVEDAEVAAIFRLLQRQHHAAQGNDTTE